MSELSFAITPFGESGFLATLQGGDIIARALSANAAADHLRAVHGIVDSVAGVESLVIRFRPGMLSAQDAHKALSTVLRGAPDMSATPTQVIDIPVCYGGAHGPDVKLLCERLSLSAEHLIKLHTTSLYRVLTIGFAPGFAYLGPLPDSLRTERLPSPRPHVPAGSVGIAGAMTGIYPLASPGGWPLIGRTPVKLFDAEAHNPFMFSPGAEVRFTPISAAEFAALQEDGA